MLDKESLTQRMQLFYDKMSEELCNTVEFYFVDKEISPEREKVRTVFETIDRKEGRRRFLNKTDVFYDGKLVATAEVFVEYEKKPFYAPLLFKYEGKKHLLFEITPHYDFKGFK